MADLNATMNGSTASQCDSRFNPLAWKIGETIAYCLIFVVSLVGNFFIALIVYKTQSMRKPINFFIVSIAMSDLLFPTFVLPPQLIGLYTNFWFISGPLGPALCKLCLFAGYVSMAVSSQNLVLITLDRFWAVVFPFRSPLFTGSKLCSFVIMASWIVAIAVFSPLLLRVKLVEFQGRQLCDRTPYLALANYYLTILFVFCYIPVALLTIIYSIILIKLKLQKIPGEQSVNADKQRARRNRNVLKMAIAIVLGFVLCWVPYNIYYLVVFFARDWLNRCRFGRYYLYIAASLRYVSSVINPCICFIFSGNYRRGFKKLLKFSG